MRSLYARLHDRFAAPPRRDGVSRRQMLLTSLSAGAGLLLSRNGFAQAAARGRVVVIGAGFSGLAAAYELASVGIDVTTPDFWRSAVESVLVQVRRFVELANQETAAK